MSDGLPRGERAEVTIVDEEAGTNEEVTVYDHVTVVEEHYVNSVNGYETFNRVKKGDDSHGSPPEAVTERVARLLWHEFNIDLDKSEYDNIRVVDTNAENVHVP